MILTTEQLEQRLVSYSLPCPGITAQDVLRAAKGNSRFYWRDQQRTLAGFGTALEITAWRERFASVHRQVQRLFQNAVTSQVMPRLFGGFSFTRDFIPDNTWAIFAPAYFVLPHYQFTQEGEAAWLTLNVLLPLEENPDDILAEMHEALIARRELLQDDPHPTLPRTWGRQEGVEAFHPAPIQIDYPMPFDTWAEKITEATTQIRAGEMQKVVLARVAELQFGEPVNVDAALAYLDQHYPECYRFLFEPRPTHAFYGATPELLVQVSGDQITTMGLAGSIGRGKTADEDAQLADQILHDPKELLEHALVVAEIKERLQPVTTDLHMPSHPQIYPLSNIQHLHTPISGTLKHPAGVLPLVEQLHPTPALGGAPRELALDFIQRAEPVPRGWYAAPMGWIDANLDGMFGVAIRSAISQDRRVWLYAGAGIVGESIPQKEWDETGLKFKAMLNAHGAG